MTADIVWQYYYWYDIPDSDPEVVAEYKDINDAVKATKDMITATYDRHGYASDDETEASECRPLSEYKTDVDWETWNKDHRPYPALFKIPADVSKEIVVNIAGIDNENWYVRQKDKLTKWEVEFNEFLDKRKDRSTVY